MITIGNKETKTLISLSEVEIIGKGKGHHAEQLCPAEKFWADHPRAPWNAFWSDDPAYWKTEFPDAWGAIADDFPEAPWNKPEPDRDPANYFSPDGEPILWTAPLLIPLVKLPAPEDVPAGSVADPKLVWYEDRVERYWEIRKETESEKKIRVPGSVSKKNFCIALYRVTGITREQISEMLAEDYEHLLEWEESATIEREHPLISAVAIQLGKSETDVDEIFTLAGQPSN